MIFKNASTRSEMKSGKGLPNKVPPRNDVKDFTVWIQVISKLLTHLLWILIKDTSHPSIMFTSIGLLRKGTVKIIWKCTGLFKWYKNEVPYSTEIVTKIKGTSAIKNSDYRKMKWMEFPVPTRGWLWKSLDRSRRKGVVSGSHDNDTDRPSKEMGTAFIPSQRHKWKKESSPTVIFGSLSFFVRLSYPWQTLLTHLRCLKSFVLFEYKNKYDTIYSWVWSLLSLSMNFCLHRAKKTSLSYQNQNNLKYTCCVSV